MKSLRRLTTLIVVLVGGAAFALWLMQNFTNIWEPALRARLEDGLSQALRERVQIDSVSMVFLNRFKASNVQIWSNDSPPRLLFRATSVSLTISLIDLPAAVSRQRPIDSIGLLTLEDPFLELSSPLLTHFKSLARANGSPPRPLLFSVVWDGGTLRWIESGPEGYAVTLHQAKGALRLRGPKTDFALRGALDQAPLVRLEMSALGSRWNARALISDGDIASSVSLAETILHRKLLPTGWQALGHATFEVVGGAKRWPQPGEKPWRFLEKGSLTLASAGVRTAPNRPAILLNGSLIDRGTRWSAKNLQVSFGRTNLKMTGSVSPFPPDPRWDARLSARGVELSEIAEALGQAGFVQGAADLEGTVQGPLHDPLMNAHVHLAQGQWKGVSIHDVDVQTQHERQQWTLTQASGQILGGTLHAHGNFSTAHNALKVSGEHLSLAEAIPRKDLLGLDGFLNFAVDVEGPSNNPEATGSLWLNKVSISSSTVLEARGDIDLTLQHLEAQAASTDGHFDFALTADRDGEAYSIERLEMHLPDGSSFSGDATLSSSRKLDGTLSAYHVVVPGLFLPLGRWTPGLSGTAELRGHLKGSLDNPTVEGTLSSDDAAAGGEMLSPVKATFSWSHARLTLPGFTVGSTVKGMLTATDPSRPWTLVIHAISAPAEPLLRLIAPHARLPGTLSTTVQIHADGLDVAETHFASAQASANGQGQARWSRSSGSAHIDQMHFGLKGRAVSSQEGPLWEFPFHADGVWSSEHGGHGEADLQTESVMIRKKPTDPLEAHFRWDHSQFAWTRTHWGTHWHSDGSLRFGGDSPALQASLEVADAPAVFAARWIGWARPDEIDGRLRGTATLSGTMAQPMVTIQTHVTQGRWRAFHFQSDIAGQWKRDGDSSLSVAGLLESSGPVSFHGVIHPDRSIQGNLELANFNLKPLGQSLSFPEPLQGSARGTFAVQGPLDRLQFIGRVEGGPTSYGLPSHHPLRLESYFLDLHLAPSPDSPQATRLTISKGLIKTAEEEIRLRNGSFADFAPGQEARLACGADLRNVHLGLFTLFGGIDLDGRWQIKPAGFAIVGDILSRSLFINDYELERGHVNVEYYDNVLRFSAPPHAPRLVTGTVDFRHAPQIQFTDFLLSGSEGQGLRLNGDIGPSRWNFQMAGNGLDVGTLAGLGGFPYSLSGTANLTVRGTGDFTHPHLEGSLELSDGSALGLAYQSGQAQLVWQNDRITFTQLALTYPGRYKLVGTGSVPVVSQPGQPPKDPKIDFSVRLQDSNLSLLQSLSSEVKKARGSVQGILQVTGTMERPLLHGSLRVGGGDIVGAHYFRHLQNLLLSIDFDRDKILLRELQGDSEGGTLLADGVITLNGFVPSAYDLTADVTSGRGLNVQVPELAIPESPLAKRFHFLTTISQADVKGHVTFKGPADAPDFKGVATISNGHFTFPPSRKNPPPPAILDWFRKINWNVRLQFQDGAWFENEYVQASLAGALKLKGPSDALRVDGSLDITQGEISYLGLAFDIRQARFDVVSQEETAVVSNIPYVSGVADSQVQATDTLNGPGSDPNNRLTFNDTITLTIDRAPVDEIKPRLTSANNPNLSQEKVLARATQIDLNNLTPQERTYVYQQQMIQILDTGLATPLAKSFLKRTGLIDNFRVQRVIDPSGVSPVTANPNTPNALTPVSQNPFANTKYTVEKDLFNRVTVGYGFRFVPVLTPDLQDKLNLVSDVQLSYRWFKNVYVKADADLPSSNPGIVPERKVTIEPTFRFGWWGNTNKDKMKAAPPATNTPSTTSH